jgi:hypothetical protein
MNNDRSSNNFPGSFLFGVLIGAAIVFLLGTKKGKKILKTISEEGIGNLNNLLEKADKATNLDEIYEEEDDEVVPQTKIIAVNKDIDEKPKIRRFFRGIPRHLN